MGATSANLRPDASAGVEASARPETAHAAVPTARARIPPLAHPIRPSNGIHTNPYTAGTRIALKQVRVASGNFPPNPRTHQ